MSEYLAGPQGQHVDDARPVDGGREHVRFGIPFNSIVPI